MNFLASKAKFLNNYAIKDNRKKINQILQNLGSSFIHATRNKNVDINFSAHDAFLE